MYCTTCGRNEPEKETSQQIVQRRKTKQLEDRGFILLEAKGCGGWEEVLLNVLVSTCCITNHPNSR